MPTTPLGLWYPDATDPVTGPTDNGATQIQALAESIDDLLIGPPAETFLDAGTFSAVASVSLPDNSFTSAFDDYVLRTRVEGSTWVIGGSRLRAGGTDDSTSGHYWSTRALSYSSTGSVLTNEGGDDDFSRTFLCGSGEPAFAEMAIISPALAEKTVIQVHGTGNYNTTGNTECSLYGRHSQATAYDSLTLLADTGTITGRWTLTGRRKAA